MCVAPTFDDHEMCDSEECFHNKTSLIWFVNLTHKSSLYQKAIDVHVIGTKFIKSLFAGGDLIY